MVASQSRDSVRRRLRLAAKRAGAEKSPLPGKFLLRLAKFRRRGRVAALRRVELGVGVRLNLTWALAADFAQAPFQDAAIVAIAHLLLELIELLGVGEEALPLLIADVRL